MKLKRQMKSLKKKNGIKYGIAGVLCLMVAAVLLIWNVGGRARAADVDLGGNSISLDQVGDVYQITTEEQLKALGEATDTETRGKKFALAGDISVNTISNVARGNFAGRLDGQGHVITIASVTLPANGEAGEISHGVLFGTISGTVENLVVDIQGDVDYSRSSKVEKANTILGENIAVNGNVATAPYSGTGEISKHSSDTQAKLYAQKLDNVSGGDLINVAGVEYCRVPVQENVIKTSTYDLEATGTDQFGVLCGTLTENASISQVYIKGGSLNVEQQTELVSTKTTQEGSRNKYFYYQKEIKDFEQDASASISSYTETAEKVSVYNSEAVQTEAESDGKNKVTITAPKYVEKGGRITYEVKIENKTTAAITGVVIETTENYSATCTKADGTAVNIGNGSATIPAGTTETFVYTLDNPVTANVEANFKVNYWYATTKDVSGNDIYQEKTLEFDALDSQMVDTGATVAGASNGSDLLITLTPKYSNYLTPRDTPAEVEYQLEIKNNLSTAPADRKVLTITDDDITFIVGTSPQSIAWKNENGTDFVRRELATGEGMTLTGTAKLELSAGQSKTERTAKVTVEPSKLEMVYENVNFYKYVADITAIPDLEPYGEVDYSGHTENLQAPDTYAGNHLNAGIFAGTSKGSITECKQNMQISATSQNTTREQLRAGGVVGRAEGTANASSLYLLGDATYDGEGSGLPTGSATRATTSIPSQGEWASYTKYASDGTKQECFDLSWLVKVGSFQCDQTVTSNNRVNVAYSDSGWSLTPDMEYAMAYNVRKSMADTLETSIYVTTHSSAIELGDSGYYRFINGYMSNGYYHYVSPAVELEDAEWVYPYANPVTDNPYIIKDEDISVVRLLNPLRDEVQLHMASAAGASDAKIYYNVNSVGSIPDGTSATLPLSSDGKVTLPFEDATANYQITPIIDGHIYPTQETRTVEETERQALPKPEITAYNYYDTDGVLNQYVDLTVNGTYEAGTDMKIVPTQDAGNEENYSFRYVYTNLAPASGEWDGEQKYIGSNPTFMDGVVGYVDSAVIPDNLANTGAVYMYVEIGRKNYDTAIYCYGPFSVTPGNKLSSTITSTGQVLLGGEIVDGDIALLSGAPQGATIQCMVADESETSFNWQNYNTGGIKMSQAVGNTIYARINYGNGKYSKVSTFSYTYAGVCASPRVIPNTGLSSDGEVAAITMGSGSTVTLSTRTDGAEILYLLSDTSRAIKIERVAVIPSDVSSDGEVSSDGYKYIEVGERWYRTTCTELEKYTEAIMLRHDKKETQLKYLSAVAVADGYEISPVVEYLFKVEEMQQVAKPEATLETRYLPGNEEAEIAAITSGSTISFFSITPEAELFYAIGSGSASPSTPIPSEGIPVEGEYNTNFVVRVQAKKEGMLDSDILTFVYTIAGQETTSAPTATPGTTQELPTVVIPGNKIILSSATREASIYYTTDGSVPLLKEETEGVYTSANETTLLYDSNVGIVMPADGSGFFTITAVAVKSGLAKSPEVRFTYAYPNSVLEPYANVESGKVELNTAVFLKNLTEGATIYYAVGYGDEEPEEPSLSGAVFSDEYPFVITQRTKIKAMAVKDGVKSSVVTFIFDPLAQLDIPQPSIDSGSVVSRGTTLEFQVLEGATVYYTMDGSDPTDGANAAVMSGKSLLLNGEPGGQITIKAYAVAPDQSRSEVGTFTYQFSQTSGGLTASLESGSRVSYGTKVNLMSDVTDAEIYYTTDGSSPAEGGIKGTTVEINGTPGSSFTVKAVAIVNDVPGIVSTFIYKIKEKPSAPIASPSEGTLTVATRVALSSGVHKVYYTTDGTEPTKSSNMYAEPILINRTTTLKAIAISEEGEVSDVVSFQYTAAEKAEMPTANKDASKVLEPGTKVVLESETKNASIYYSVDGTEPALDNLEDLMVYAGGIEINRSVTIKAVAYREDLQLSNVATWNYTVETIPAVQMKEAEAAKLAEEGLQDTDTEGLVRNNQQEETPKGSRTIKDEVHRTSVSFTEKNVAKSTVLQTKENDIEREAVKAAKELFGEDYTILSSYYMWLEADSSYARVEGEVEVGLPIPEGYENATLTIVEVSDKKLKPLNTKRADGMLYAKTGSISKYAVVGPENLEKSTDSISYLLILEVISGLTLAGGMVYFCIEKIKKICRNRKDYPTE